MQSNDPGRTRTCNPRLRRPMPYPLGHGALCTAFSPEEHLPLPLLSRDRRRARHNAQRSAVKSTCLSVFVPGQEARAIMHTLGPMSGRLRLRNVCSAFAACSTILSTVAILAQGTHWAVAPAQAYCKFSCWPLCSTATEFPGRGLWSPPPRRTSLFAATCSDVERALSRCVRISTSPAVRAFLGAGLVTVLQCWQ